jgi:hypothetical protein
MGILLVYDVTDEASFNNIRNWMRNIEQHASDNVNKVRRRRGRGRAGRAGRRGGGASDIAAAAAAAAAAAHRGIVRG